jgi:hypothetical protein
MERMGKIDCFLKLKDLIMRHEPKRERSEQMNASRCYFVTNSKNKL